MTLDDLNVEDEWKRFYQWFHILTSRRIGDEDPYIDITQETAAVGAALGYSPIPGRWRMFIPHWDEREAKDWMEFKLTFEYDDLDEYVKEYHLEYPDQFPWPYELINIFAGLGLLYRSPWQHGMQSVVRIFLTANGGDLAKDNL